MNGARHYWKCGKALLKLKTNGARWPKVRGGLSIEWPLERGLIMYLLLNGCEEVRMPPDDMAF